MWKTHMQTVDFHIPIKIMISEKKYNCSNEKKKSVEFRLEFRKLCYSNALNPASKMWPRASKSSLTCKLGRKADSQTSRGPTEFICILIGPLLGWFTGVWKLQKHCSFLKKSSTINKAQQQANCKKYWYYLWQRIAILYI